MTRISSRGGAGSPATSVPVAAFDAAGDLLVGTGNDVYAKLTKGSALQTLRVNAAGTALEYATPVSGAAYPNSSGTATVAARPGLVYDIRDYGALANARTLWSGATTSGNTTLTDATAPFAAGDVGKVIVVNNGVSNGTHLYTTIAGFTDASHVTLTTAPTNTITTALYSFGTDDLAAWNAAIAACPAGGAIQFPATPSLVTSKVILTKPVSVVGVSLVETWGLLSTNGSKVMPTVAPFLNGSVLIQAGANQDGFYTTAAGATINFSNVGVYFAGLWKTTGNGFNMSSTATSVGLGLDNGLDGAYWSNTAVFGQDATHYALRTVNPLLDTFVNFNSYGGGGFWFENNSNQNPYGNVIGIGLFHVFLCGALPGFNGLATLGTGLTNSVFIRPQTVSGSYAGTLWANWNLSGSGGLAADLSTSSQIIVTSPDFEAGNITVSANNIELSAGGTPYPYPVTGKADTAPFWRAIALRRLNMDGSISLDSAEAAGSSLNLLRNNANGGRVWGITTDSTEKLLIPGRFSLSGDGPPPPVAGAALGTAPPFSRTAGTDVAGSAFCGSGSATTTGTLLTFTFGTAYSYTPSVIITPQNAATAALGLYATPTATGFTVGCTVAPTASQPVNTYAFSYQVMGGIIPATVGIYDTFTRADTAASLGTTDSGHAWSVLGGTLGISSNRAYWVSNGASNAMSTVTTSSGDFVLDVDLTTVAGGTGVLLRAASAASYICTSAGSLVSYTGSYTTLGNFTSGFVTGDHLTAVCQGSNISIRKNGKQVLAVTSTLNQTTAKAGLRGDTTGSVWDNFAVG